jgi:hypothetical protein
MNSPSENPDPSPLEPPVLPAPDKDSVLIGFLAGWGAMIGFSFLSGAIVAVTGPLLNGSFAFSVISLIAGLIPIAGLAGLMIWFAMKGKTRSVKGVVAAFGSLLALCLLLVAACFGLFALSGGGNLH